MEDPIFQNLLHKTEHFSGHCKIACHALAQLNETNPKHYSVHVKRCKNLVQAIRIKLVNPKTSGDSGKSLIKQTSRELAWKKFDCFHWFDIYSISTVYL